MDLPPTSILCWRRLKNRQFSTKFGTFVPEWLQDFFFLVLNFIFYFALPAFSNCKLCLLPIFFYRFCLDTNHFRCKMFQIDQNKKFVVRFFYDLILRRQSTMVQSLYPGITNFRKMCFFQKSILRTCTKLPNFEQWW